MVSHKTKPAPGRIRDSNGPLLAALAMNHGAQVVDVELAVDGDLSQVKNILEELLRRADIVLTTGGTARGEYDQALWAVRQTGARVLFGNCKLSPAATVGRRSARIS
ncbi:MAG: molybdopterin-binding protein [Candidatus Syntrophopropionicum ammoniitolerans]